MNAFIWSNWGNGSPSTTSTQSTWSSGSSKISTFSKNSTIFCSKRAIPATPEQVVHVPSIQFKLASVRFRALPLQIDIFWSCSKLFNDRSNAKDRSILAKYNRDCKKLYFDKKFKSLRLVQNEKFRNFPKNGKSSNLAKHEKRHTGYSV